MKTKKIFNTYVIALGIVVSSIGFQGCEKDEILENSTKENVLILAEKYGLQIDFNTVSTGKVRAVESIQELENAFQKINEQRKKGAKMQLTFNKSAGNKVFASTIKKNRQKISLQRLKSGNIEAMNSWFYDLTWYNLVLTYEKSGGSVSNISVNGSYEGLSFYTYTQTASTTSVEDGIITFQTYGYETHEWSILGVTFTETRAITTSGTYNTNTNTGSVDLSGNGYWFH
jgi:hypothetical protein